MTTKAKAKTANTAESAVEAGKEQFEKAVKAGTKAASKNFEQSFEFARKQMDEAVKHFDDFSAVSKANVEAFIASTNKAVEGIEALNAEFVALSKKNLEGTVEASKTLAGAKNIRDFVEAQNALAKTSYETFVADSSRVSELAMSMAKDVFAPVNSQASKAFENFWRPLNG
ncbi:MAG: phasin family protein [Sphingomonadales bacterium]|jgi:phasin family protein